MELKKVKSGKRYNVRTAFGSGPMLCEDNGYKDRRPLRYPVCAKFSQGKHVFYAKARDIMGEADAS